MPVGKKKSPAKFLGAVALGLGVIQGATSIIGGIQERKRLRKENKRAKGQYRDMRDDLKSLEITNPYKDLNTTFENTFEDMTVNQQQAQFQAQQGAQARANLLSNLRSAAGGSGIAGLAQVLANQQQVQGQQISASIGQQEAANQRASAQGAMNVQRMTQQAQETIGYGDYLKQQNENERQMNLMGLKAGRQQAQRDFRGAMQAQNQQIMGGIGSIVGAGLQGFASGGGFTKGGFSMDTFLGRTPGLAPKISVGDSINMDSNQLRNRPIVTTNPNSNANTIDIGNNNILGENAAYDMFGNPINR
jgi:hypothetical protein